MTKPKGDAKLTKPTCHEPRWLASNMYGGTINPRGRTAKTNIENRRRKSYIFKHA